MALSAHALTTVATVKDELAITVSTFDSYIESLINFTSDAIERWCGRHFERGTPITETAEGYQDVFLRVARAPIVSITSIAFDDSTIDSSNYEIHDTEAGLIYFPGEAVGTAKRMLTIARDPLPGSEQKLYTIIYVGGYTLPQAGGSYTLPLALERACVLAVAQAYRQRGKDRSIKAESLLSYSVTYDGSANTPSPDGSPFSAEVTALLAPFRRMVFG